MVFADKKLMGFMKKSPLGTVGMLLIVSATIYFLSSKDTQTIMKIV